MRNQKQSIEKLDPWRYTDEQRERLAVPIELIEGETAQEFSDRVKARHRGLPRRGPGAKGDLSMPGREFGVPGYGTSKMPTTYRTVTTSHLPRSTRGFRTLARDVQLGLRNEYGLPMHSGPDTWEVPIPMKEAGDQAEAPPYVAIDNRGRLAKLLQQMKRKAGYNPMTPEMINKANGGDE